MSDGLSLWDILLLKDEISVEEWVILSWIIPIAIVVLVIAGIFVYGYWDDIIYRLKHPFRKKK